MRQLPYGYTPEFDIFLTVHKLKWRSEGKRCLHWVSIGRCGVSNCDVHDLPWMDHATTYFTENRDRLMLCQPYQISPSDLSSMLQAREKFDLSIYINGGGWYGNGTCAVWIYHKSEEHP